MYQSDEIVRNINGQFVESGNIPWYGVSLLQDKSF